MTSWERVQAALEHQEPDRVPIDLGGCHQTGMHVDSVYKLRQALHLDPPGTPVTVEDPFQMLGEIAADLLDAVGGDVVPLRKNAGTIFGYRNEGWKPWTTFAGTPVLVPEKFNTTPEPNGDILQYPQGDTTAPPSGRMPKGGFYFDAIVRQDPIDDDHRNVEELEDYHTCSSVQRMRPHARSEHLSFQVACPTGAVLPAAGSQPGGAWRVA